MQPADEHELEPRPIRSMAPWLQARPPSQDRPTREELDAEERHRVEGKIRTAGLEAFRLAGFPKRHRDRMAQVAAGTARQNHPGYQAAFERSYDQLQRDGATLVLLGPRGAGKTQMATELAAKLAGTGLLGEAPSISYQVLGELLNAERSTFGADGAREKSPLAAASRVSLLVLDELHERGETAWEDRALTQLFDRRYREVLRTVIVTNLEAQALRDRVPASMWDRLLESCAIVECGGTPLWPSFRAQGGGV